MAPSSRTLLLVAVVVLGALAGCTGLGFDGDAASPIAEDEETPTDESPTRTESATATDVETATATDTETATEADFEPPETGPGNTSATFLASEDDVTVTLEIANTSDERREGLMFRESLPENHGMVFVYPDADRRRFWMKDTLIPLDIVFVAPNGTVLNVEHADPERGVDDADLERYESEGDAQYVIELQQGFANRTGVEAGTEVVFHDDLEAADANRRLETRSRDRNRLERAELATTGEGVIPSAPVGRMWYSESSSVLVRPAR